MKRKIRISLIVIACLIGILLFFDAFGMFAKIVISRKNMGPFVLIYDSWTGDYKHSGATMGKVKATLLESFQLKCRRTFGLYLDNPEQVKTDELRSIAGCIIENKNMPKLANKKTNFEIAEFPRTEIIVTEFPFKGPLSIFLGVTKVYPKLKEYIQSNHITPGPIMEIYDPSNEKITYLLPMDVSKESLEAMYKKAMYQK